MLKKKISILFILVLFIFSTIFLVPHNKSYTVQEIYSPISISLNNGNFILKNLDTFDANFTTNNQNLAVKLKISEEEAFALGNLGKYWTEGILKNRKVTILNNDLRYSKYSYREKFLYSGFCIVDSKPYNDIAFNKRLNEIRKGRYKVLDLDTNTFHDLYNNNVRNLKNFVLIRKSHLQKIDSNNSIKSYFKKDNIKIFLSDSTSVLKPHRNCSTGICKEILDNINNAKDSIDIAIYGYSRVYAIEKALENALKRGVKIRIIYDIDSNGKNIYPDTEFLLNILKNNNSDKDSKEFKNIMHNKFYIFDNKVLITGSANLSHTDMSGYNSNSIIVFNSDEIAKIYKNEFEQMYNGNFHNEKNKQTNKNLKNNNLKIYFSPQDKSITNAILPIIKNAQKYIYIPTFVLTEKRITEELIKAKQRGVDVKIIIDALNASIHHSKHNELRAGGLLVKTENYAGKMHSKSMIIDDKYTIIGSMNFSNSGENKNDENLIVIDDTDIAKFYKTFFLYQWEQIDNKYLNTNVRAESKESIGSCYDGIDNNYDGLTDMNDVACK